MVLIPKNLLGHYKPNFGNNTLSLLNEVDAYQVIQSNDYSKQITQEIQTRFKNGLENGFNPDEKKLYQKAKAQGFESVTFSIRSKRKKGSEVEHTNLICLDVDENTFEEHTHFRNLIHDGKVPFARASAFSVSGAYNGSMWVNVWCDITSAIYSEHKDLFKLLGLNQSSSKSKISQALHVAYSDLLRYELSVFDIRVSKRSHVQPRYLSHDADMYVDLTAKKFTLNELYDFILRSEKQKREIQRKRIEDNTHIPSGDWMKICDYFANEKINSNDNGADALGRMYCFYFGCKANLLGIEKEQVLQHIKDKFDLHEKTFNSEYENQLIDAYTSYKDSFATSSKLLHQIDEFTISLNAGERLNDKAKEVDVLLQEHSYLELVANCGIGKNYASVYNISDNYRLRTGERTVIICSLNQKVKKDAEQYNLPYLTGERLNDSITYGHNLWSEFEDAPVILCNQNQFPKLASYLKSKNEKCLAIVDEVQTLSKAYKESTSKKLLSALNMSAREIIVMTGTPKDYFQELGFKRVRVLSHHSKINIIVREREKNWLLNLGQVFKDYQDQNKMLLVKYNNKKALATAKDYLINQFALKDENVLVIHSDISKSEREVFEDKLNSDKVNSFDGGVKVVLCTSAINEGIDIYSEREIILVNFERTGLFAPDELVQFADRWRVNSEEKTLICYFAIIDQKERGFNTYIPAVMFEELYSLYKSVCNGLNETLSKSPNYSQKALISLQNRFSDECRYIYFDEELMCYYPDVIACMIEIENNWLSKCTCNEGMEYITSNFDYFNIEFDKLSYEFDESAKALASELAENEKINRKKAKDLYTRLYNTDKNILFQAILKACEDPEVKAHVEKSITYGNQAQELIEKFPELFSKYISIGKQLVKRDAQLRYFLLEDEEVDVLVFNGDSIRSQQGFSDVHTGLKLHVLLMLLDYSQAHPEQRIMTREQEREAHRLNNFIEGYPMNEFFTQDEIVRLVQTHYRRNGKMFKVTKQNAMCLVKAFFKLEHQRFGGQKKEFRYTAIAKKGMNDFLMQLDLKNTSLIMERIEENLKALL